MPKLSKRAIRYERANRPFIYVVIGLKKNIFLRFIDNLLNYVVLGAPDLTWRFHRHQENARTTRQS